MQNAGSLSAQWPTLWRVIGALALGAVLAYWSWALFAPQSAAVAVTAPREPAAEAGRLFGGTGEGQAGGGLVNASLVGVFAPSQDSPGFAVLLLDGKNQFGLALGESTPSGAMLVEIHPDHVVLERAGMRQQVMLEGAKPAQ
ncbi:MAG: hypothetical protein LBE50_06635 [Gallionellaceae bacterium]|nr:hypothetical protein [Gallionellaceae bacterium]